MVCKLGDEVRLVMVVIIQSPQENTNKHTHKHF